MAEVTETSITVRVQARGGNVGTGTVTFFTQSFSSPAPSR